MISHRFLFVYHFETAWNCKTLNPTESFDPWIHRSTMAHWGDMFPGCHRWLVRRYCITLRQPDQFPIEPPSRCPLSILVPKNHLLGFTSSDLNGEESIDYLHMFFWWRMSHCNVSQSHCNVSQPLRTGRDYPSPSIEPLQRSVLQAAEVRPASGWVELSEINYYYG